MEDDIQNYLPTVMFYGAPCTITMLNSKIFLDCLTIISLHVTFLETKFEN